MNNTELSNIIWRDLVGYISLCKTHDDAEFIVETINQRLKTFTMTLEQYNTIMEAFAKRGFTSIIIPKPLPARNVKYVEDDEDAYQLGAQLASLKLNKRKKK
jgi:hypothetical protein